MGKHVVVDRGERRDAISVRRAPEGFEPSPQPSLKKCCRAPCETGRASESELNEGWLAPTQRKTGRFEQASYNVPSSQGGAGSAHKS